MKRLFLLFIFSLFLLTACTSNTQTTPANAADLGWNGQTKEFTVRAFQYGFEPNILEVNKGDKVIITGYSSDVPHSLTLSEFNVDLKLNNPEKKTVEFIADKTGTFTFRCRVPCGHGHSTMQGTFIVKE